MQGKDSTNARESGCPTEAAELRHKGRMKGHPMGRWAKAFQCRGPEMLSNLRNTRRPETLDPRARREEQEARTRSRSRP